MAFLLLSAAVPAATYAAGTAAAENVSAAAFGAGFSADQAVKDLSSPNAETRRQAAWNLGYNHAAAAVQALIGALKREKKPIVREHIVFALGEIADKRAVPLLADLAASDGQLGVRLSATAALHEIDDPAALAVLETLAADPKEHPYVRRQALMSVGNRKGAAALETLSAAAADKDPSVRETAVDALGRIDDPRALSELKNAASDADAGVRGAARMILDRRDKDKAARDKAAKGASRKKP